MANSPSIISFSSKQNLPTDLSITEEAKGYSADEFPPRDSVSPSYYQKIIAEILGTYVLVFAGCGAALVDREKTLTVVGLAMVWGLALMAMIYALGHVSGGHFNPAVTIGFAAARKIPLVHVPLYVLSQFLGSTLACLTLKVLFNDQADILPTLTHYSSSTTDLEAITWEFVITFIFMLTIRGVASDDRANNELAGVAIGATVIFNALVAGPITGASMNPARSMGPAIVSGVYKNQWVYVVAPILGAIAASLIYSLLQPWKPEKNRESARSTYNDLYLRPEV
ncbi:nodulin-26-like [Olea europaea subsp. europaea]|uniref:Nodulin-26-like n=1 Tax=Olea europaea subsp. europaea TaxID=158383 RepID=A0A8S0Q1V6_OLEEU|nr:nodulin-26-like [Olea europaea subsp. europaea]